MFGAPVAPAGLPPTLARRAMPSDRIEAEEIRKFEQQFSEHPESFVFARLADAYRKSGNPRRALEILESGLERHPEYLSARIVHARCLMELDRAEEAMTAWRRVLELDPQNLVALGELEAQARMADDSAAPQPASTGGSDAATGDGEDAETPSHDAGMVTETMADLYLKQGLYEEAAGIYGELVKRRPTEPGLRDRLARASALASGEVTAGWHDVVRLAGRGAPSASEREAGSPLAGDPDEDDRCTKGTGGIRSHLQALIGGRAPTAPSALGPAGEAEDGEAALRSGPGDTRAEASSSGFGDWLRSRR